MLVSCIVTHKMLFIAFYVYFSYGSFIVIQKEIGMRIENNTYYINLEQEILQAADSLMSGNDNSVNSVFMVYKAFALGDKELVKKAGIALEQYVSSQNTKQMIRLSERIREFKDWFIDWKLVDLNRKRSWFEADSDYKCSLIIGSYNSNGYYRERCTDLLAEFPDTLTYLMIRTNDWVDVIRKKSFLLVMDRIKECDITELVPAIQVLEKLRYSGRIERKDFESIEKAFYERMEKSLGCIPLDKIYLCEFDTRKYIYRLIISRNVLDFEQINLLLEYEKHSFCKQILILGILNKYGCDIEQVDIYLMNKNAVVRRHALEYKYNIIKDTWDGLSDILLDINRSVRSLASFIIRRHTDLSLIDFYIEHLNDDNPLPAIIGVGENGGKKEGKLLLPFLKTDSVKIIRATLEMLGITLGIDCYDIYLEYLQSEEYGIVKSAYKAIKTAGIRYGAKYLYDICINAKSPQIIKYALRLIQVEDSWERLPFLLELYSREDFLPYINYIYPAICTRSMYVHVSKEQSELIKKILEEKKDVLSEGLAKAILFEMKFVLKS